MIVAFRVQKRRERLTPPRYNLYLGEPSSLRFSCHALKYSLWFCLFLLLPSVRLLHRVAKAPLKMTPNGPIERALAHATSRSVIQSGTDSSPYEQSNTSPLQQTAATSPANCQQHLVCTLSQRRSAVDWMKKTKKRMVREGFSPEQFLNFHICLPRSIRPIS